MDEMGDRSDRGVMGDMVYSVDIVYGVTWETWATGGRADGPDQATDRGLLLPTVKNGISLTGLAYRDAGTSKN